MRGLLVLLCIAAPFARSQSSFRAPEQPVRFTHIPKTGGTSLRVDLAALGHEIGHLEFCASAPDVGFLKGGWNFVFLRSPRAHVLSQFLECRYDEWGKTMTAQLPEFPFPTGDDESAFEHWVAHFHNSTFSADGRLAHDWNCYSPHS